MEQTRVGTRKLGECLAAVIRLQHCQPTRRSRISCERSVLVQELVRMDMKSLMWTVREVRVRYYVIKSVRFGLYDR